MRKFQDGERVFVKMHRFHIWAGRTMPGIVLYLHDDRNENGESFFREDFRLYRVQYGLPYNNQMNWLESEIMKATPMLEAIYG